MARHKPVIGITGPRRGSLGPRFCISIALRIAGALPMQLRPGDEQRAEQLDAIVISGGHDVEPVLYKSAAEVQGNYDPERDAFESAVIKRTAQLGKPLLGICRGTQLINVVFGGSLFQDLQKIHGETRRRRSVFPIKTVELEPNSRLAATVGVSSLRVNSLHNQSIDRLGDGLNITARDARGVVQAVEGNEELFIAGVQWHPEFLIYQSASRKLFAEFAAAAAAKLSSA